MKFSSRSLPGERIESHSFSARPIVSFYQRWRPIFILGGVVVLAIGARLALRWQLPLPFCALRRFTGIPCPSCGCTRSLASWANLDVAQAFRFNPLFSAICVTALVWLALWMADKFSGKPILGRLHARLRRWPWWRIGIVLVAANWLYLWLALPK